MIRPEVTEKKNSALSEKVTKIASEFRRDILYALASSLWVCVSNHFTGYLPQVNILLNVSLTSFENWLNLTSYLSKDGQTEPKE